MSTANTPKTIDLPQGSIRYRDLGDGDPVVFVHGLLVDGRLWDGVAERLADRFRCLTVDWPMGSHRTPMKPDADLSPSGQVEVIVAFMDALGLERATVIGNDTGGAASQMLTARHPDRVGRLILTNCDTFEHFPPFPFSLMPPVARLPGGMTMLSAPFRLGPVRRGVYAMLARHRIDPELIDAWLEPSQSDPEISRDAAKLIAGVDKQELIDADEALRRFERPVRFAWGSEDRFFKLAHAERLAAVVPDARIVSVPDAGTFVPLDQPRRVADLVAEFMRETLPAQAP
jgi:pimeloyl-ACP methyl ester carboxylesterase